GEWRESRLLEPAMLVILDETVMRPLWMEKQNFRTGEEWSKKFKVMLPPPRGLGFTDDAEHRFRVTNADAQRATIQFTTQFHGAPRDRLPLSPTGPKGEIVYDAVAGVVVSATYRDEGVNKDYDGEGSRCEYSYEGKRTLVKQ